MGERRSLLSRVAAFQWPVPLIRDTFTPQEQTMLEDYWGAERTIEEDRVDGLMTWQLNVHIWIMAIAVVVGLVGIYMAR